MKTVHMEKRGDFYMSWHQDARDIAAALGDIVVTKSGGADTVGIPAHGLEEVLAALNELGISVKINSRIDAVLGPSFDTGGKDESLESAVNRIIAEYLTGCSVPAGECVECAHGALAAIAHKAGFSKASIDYK